MAKRPPRRKLPGTAPILRTPKPGTGHLPQTRVQPQTTAEHNQQQNKPITNPTTQQQPDLNKPDPAFAPIVPESGATLSQTVTKPTTPGRNTQTRPTFAGGGAGDWPEDTQAQVPPQNQTVNDVTGTGPQTQPPVAADPAQQPAQSAQTPAEQTAQRHAEQHQPAPARPAHLTEKAESNLIKRGGRLEKQFKKILGGASGTRSIAALKKLGDQIVANQIHLGASPEDAEAYAQGLMSPEQKQQLESGMERHANRPMNFQQFAKTNYGNMGSVNPVAAQRRYIAYRQAHKKSLDAHMAKFNETDEDEA